MPVQYFGCECGEEYREIVPMDRHGYTKNERTGRLEFDPVLAASTPRPPAPTHTCAKCGRTVQSSLDPKGVKTKFLFNYFED